MPDKILKVIVTKTHWTWEKQWRHQWKFELKWRKCIKGIKDEQLNKWNLKYTRGNQQQTREWRMGQWAGKHGSGKQSGWAKNRKKKWEYVKGNLWQRQSS